MASAAGLERASEKFTYSFKDDAFISMYGLSAHNALDYFAQSDFYDKSCNNEHIKMQHQPLEALLKMTGLEYALLKTGHEPHLFVVVKQRRDSAALAARLGIYYILDKTIYQAPNVHAVCVSRTRKAADHLSRAFDALAQARGFTLASGSFWDFAEDEAGVWREASESAKFRARGERSRSAKKQRQAVGEALAKLDAESRQ